jgi:hypothetical protein
VGNHHPLAKPITSSNGGQRTPAGKQIDVWMVRPEDPHRHFRKHKPNRLDCTIVAWFNCTRKSHKN